MKPTFSAAQQTWLESQGFRILKTKADKPFGDGRHILELAFHKWSDEEWHLWCQKMSPRYSIGESIKLKPTASPQELAKAVSKLLKNKETLGSTLEKAFAEVHRNVKHL